MKKVLVFCLLLSLWLSLDGSSVWAQVDVGWMQQGVRVWYFGGVGITGDLSSDTQEAYLFKAVDGDNVQVTKHSAKNHWGIAFPPDTTPFSFLDKGPCWIHPQVLPTLHKGDYWKDPNQKITNVLPDIYTYDTLKAEMSVPYLLLPIRALFDLKSPRNLVKIVYEINSFSTGIAYFDAETGLCLMYQQWTGSALVFFILSEINYDFQSHQAFAEDNGPHTGFLSFVEEGQMMLPPDYRGGNVTIQSSVESRYGSTVEMLVNTSACGNINGHVTCYTPGTLGWENYCFFGGDFPVPVLTHIDHTYAPNYPPELWTPYGQHLWWWVPPSIFQNSTINVFAVPMTNTPANPFLFTATQQPTARFFFSKLWFDNDGYVTQFAAKDSNTGLDIDPERQNAIFYENLTRVYGLAYYKNTMGIAVPSVFSDVPPGFWAYDYIMAIYNAGITTGYPDGTYRPAENVSRSQMAAFIIRAEHGESFTYCPTPHFTDVPDTHWAFKYVERMYEDGITTGYPDNTYRPAENVTRGQMAAFIVRGKFGETFPYSTTPYFTDVPASHGSFKYIQKVSEEGIASGYPDGTYRPSQNVNRAQMAAFIARAFKGMQ